MIRVLTGFLLVTLCLSTMGQTGRRMKASNNLTAGHWPLEKSQPIIDKTQTIRLAPTLEHLTTGERNAVQKLLKAGQIFQTLFILKRKNERLDSVACEVI